MNSAYDSTNSAYPTWRVSSCRMLLLVKCILFMYKSFFKNNFGESMANWAKYSWTTQCIDQFVTKVPTVDMAFNVNAYSGCLTTKKCFSSIESFTVDAW